MIYNYNGKKLKLVKVRLYRKNYNRDSDSCLDYDNYFGDIIVADMGGTYKEILTGTHIPVVSYIDERDYHQGIWEHVPHGSFIAEEVHDLLSEEEIVLYIRYNEINGFSDRLYGFCKDARAAAFQHFKGKLTQKIRIRK